MAADRIIWWSTAGAVVGVAAVAAMASYEDAHDLVRVHGEAGLTGATGAADGGWADLRQFDGDVDSARWTVQVPPLARWLLGLGIAANVAHGLGHGPAGAAWPAIALVGSHELLMVIIRSVEAPAGTAAGSGASGAPGDDLLQAWAAEAFAGEVAAGRGSALLSTPPPHAKIPFQRCALWHLTHIADVRASAFDMKSRACR
jgi:hypothetical protein